MSITTRDQISVSATSDRLIEIKLGRQKFHLLPGTAQGLREMLQSVQAELFDPKNKPAVTPTKAAASTVAD